MKYKRHIVGVLQTNCYVVWDEDSLLAVIIDPGANSAKLKRTLKEKDLSLQAIIHTHDHWDHTAATDALQRATGAPLFRHPKSEKSGFFHRSRRTDQHLVHDLAHGQTLAFGPLAFQVIHTPGHSPGSLCLHIHDLLFVGDLLFQGSVGRWDLKGGSFRELVRSLNERLAHLPDQTRVLPGHGPATTLGQERKTNPFFRSARELKKLGPITDEDEQEV